MLRVTRLTDHAIVLLTRFAQEPRGVVLTARDLAEEEGMTLPMVSKILKLLAGAGLLASHRGAKGGYSLARPAEAINLAEVLAALEGRLALTECNAEPPGLCEREPYCQVRPHWRVINEAVRRSLERVSLGDLVRPAPLVSCGLGLNRDLGAES